MLSLFVKLKGSILESLRVPHRLVACRRSGRDSVVEEVNTHRDLIGYWRIVPLRQRYSVRMRHIFRPQVAYQSSHSN